MKTKVENPKVENTPTDTEAGEETPEAGVEETTETVVEEASEAETAVEEIPEAEVNEEKENNKEN